MLSKKLNFEKLSRYQYKRTKRRGRCVCVCGWVGGWVGGERKREREREKEKEDDNQNDNKQQEFTYDEKIQLENEETKDKRKNDDHSVNEVW